MPQKFEDFAASSAGLAGVRKNRVRDAFRNLTLRLCGAKYPVLFIQRLVERHGVAGQTDLFNENMIIEGNLTEGEMLSSIWHEVLEVLNKKFVLNMEHDLLQKLENATFAALVDNPEYLQELLIYAKRYAKSENKKVKE